MDKSFSFHVCVRYQRFFNIVHIEHAMQTCMLDYTDKYICCRHPDKNKDPGANEKFMKINEAYEVNM